MANTIDTYGDSVVFEAFLTRDFSSCGYEFIDDILTTMKDYAFAGITDLQTLSLPNITVVSNCAFLGTQVSGTVNIPWANITSIGAYAFYQSNIIKSGAGNLTLSALTSISSCAFAEQANLTSFSAPLLENVYLGSAPFSDSRGMFEGSALQSFSAPLLNSSTFSTRAFKDCTSLTSVYLPKQQYDGERMFDGCTSLVTLSLPELTAITHQNMFSSCTALTTLSLPKLTSITALYTFNGCTAITELSLPEVTGSLGTGTFSGCTSLQKCSLPKVTGIPSSCFNECSALDADYLNIPLVTSLGGTAFYGCVSLTHFEHTGVLSTGTNCFSNCTNLVTVTLNAVDTVGASTFAYCSSLAHCELGGEITAFGNYVFRSCAALEELILSGVTSVPTISSNTFTGATKILNGTGKIYVPSALVSAFQADATWGTYSIEDIANLPS